MSGEQQMKELQSDQNRKSKKMPCIFWDPPLPNSEYYNGLLEYLNTKIVKKSTALLR